MNLFSLLDGKKGKIMDRRLFIVENEGIRCNLCPHFCLLKKDQSGRCRIRKSDGEKIYLSNYGELCNIAVDPIEKKPLRGFLSGTKTLSIGGISCNLSCPWCENFELSQKCNVQTKYFSVDEIIQIAQEKKCQSICMTFNEPTISFEYLIDLGKKCKECGLKFIIKSNALINEYPWKKVCEVIDAVNIDWKGTQEHYIEVCKSSEYVVRDRIKEACEKGVHIEISIPVHFNFLDDMRLFFECGSFLNSLNKDIICHLFKIYPSYKDIDKTPVSDETFSLVKNILKFHMSNVYIF